MAIRFMYDNIWDLAGTDLTAGSEATGFPKENTQHIWSTRHWRSTDLDDGFSIDIGEVLTDGRMEEWLDSSDLTYWTEQVEGGSAVAREDSIKQGGNYSCRLIIDASNNKASVHQGFNMISHHTYLLSGWYINSVASKTARITISDNQDNIFLNSEGTWQDEFCYIVLENSTTWKEYKLKFNAHGSYTTYKIAIRNHSAASSSIYLDNFYINFAVEAIIIKYHNLRPGQATITLKGDNFSSMTTPPLSESLTVTKNLIIKFLDEQENYQYYKIEAQDSGNPDGYIRMGRIYLGSHFEPERNYSQPHMKQSIDPSIKRYSAGGQVSICERESYIQIPYDFRSIALADIPRFKTMWNIIKQSTPYFVCEIPSSEPYLTTYYVINSDPWSIEEMSTKGSLLVNCETMR